MESAPETGKAFVDAQKQRWLFRAVKRVRGPCRSPPQSKTSPVSVSNDGIEPVSPAGANSEPDMQGGASYPSEQAEQG